jgi:hypothetical protein
VGVEVKPLYKLFSVFSGKFLCLGLDHFCGRNDGYNQLIEKHIDDCDYKDI